MTTVIESCKGCKLAPIPEISDNKSKPQYYCYYCFDIRWTTKNVETCPCQYCLVKGICTETCKEKITWINNNRFDSLSVYSSIHIND